ncbi:MAG TPA: methyltransferase domain-containing protein [Nitrospiria bacterium]|nr:methyltransferase domain-containing protein [Nitrospiria bacterium]
MKRFNEKSIWHAPRLDHFETNEISYFVDGASPNWISTDRPGAFILSNINGKNTFSDLSSIYGRNFGLEASKALCHVQTFLSNAARAGLIFDQPLSRSPYPGRESLLKGPSLKEFWIHTNNSCNLTCSHCLVSSSPEGDPGLPGERLKRIIDEVIEMGVERFYFTGGEPFLRKDIFDLIRYATEIKGKELVLLTNGLCFTGSRFEELKTLDRQKVRLQISIDGARKETNDPIRGKDTFEKILEGAARVNELGYETSLASVVTRENCEDLAGLPSIAKKAGSKSIHLMWPQKRGRILETGSNGFPGVKELFQLVKEIAKRCREENVLFDQMESFKLRVNGLPGIKYDLGNACWDSLCLYSNGHLYPSASFANHLKLDMGDALEYSIKTLFENSPIARYFRSASVAHKRELAEEPFRYFTGGGDIEQSYFYSENATGRASIEAEDPYYDLYVEMIKEAMVILSEAGKSRINLKSGFNAPLIYHAMGEGAVSCGIDGPGIDPDREVALLHSNCVLSFNVEKTRKMVQAFYGKAAEEPQRELCCPTNFDPDEISHIPEEVIERFYGCGSPVSQASVRPGETVVDLGSGGGIDCFIAAKKTGPAGRVIGIDMTPSMLEFANRNKTIVSRNLGYEVLEFREGYLEAIPLEGGTADLVTSNCVINLSPDKKIVFSEMWRVLKDHGRVVVSDIIAENPVAAKMALNPRLWGECISGALTEEQFLSYLEEAGFYGLEILKKGFWKEVEGNPFYSMTVRGYKFEKRKGCDFIGQTAVYPGPFKGVMDEEGHYFPRNEAVEICTDTAAKLKEAPYKSIFSVQEPGSYPTQIESSGRCLPGTENSPPCC